MESTRSLNLELRRSENSRPQVGENRRPSPQLAQYHCRSDLRVRAFVRQARSIALTSVGTIEELIVVADVASVGADAGSIRHLKQRPGAGIR